MGPSFGNPLAEPLARELACLHHRFDVEHPAVDVGQALSPVGHAGAPFVEHDDAGERPEPTKRPGYDLVLPCQLDMRDEAWDHDEIERSLTEDLVGDVDAIVGLGIVGLRHWIHVNI